MLARKQWDELTFGYLEAQGDVNPSDLHTPPPCLRLFSSKKSIASGAAAVLSFLLLISVWATFVPIASVMVAPAAVVSVDDIRSVIHPDGGSIASVFVKEGISIKAGTAILQFDGTALNAELAEVVSTIKQDKEIIARDDAERNWINAYAAPKEVRPDLLRANSTQQRILEDHLKVRRARDETYESGVSQLDESTTSLARQLRTVSTAEAAAEDDLRIAQTLLIDGNSSRVHLNQAIRSVAQQRSEYEDLLARIKSESARVRLLTSNHEQETANDRIIIETEQSQVERELPVLERRRVTLGAAISRLVVRAPVDGQVSLLTHKMAGESVQPGALVAEIVPDEEKTLIVARVEPQYLEQIKTGQIAELRTYQPIATKRSRILGTVIRISKSVVSNRESSGQYFSVALKVLSAPSAAGPAFTQVGFPVQVAFTQRAKSLLGYLFEPMMPGRV